MTIFAPGKTYWTRSICDSDCIFKITIAKRTAKFVTTTEGKRLGNYSMCAIIGADKVLNQS